MNWDVDCTGLTPETMDESRCPAGWHEAECTNVVEDPGEGKMVVTYITTSEPKGCVISQTFNEPSLAKTEKEQQSRNKFFRIWGVRMGVIPKTSAGKVSGCDPRKAIGRKCVLHVVDNVYTKEDGNVVSTTKIDYAGVYPLDHAEIPEKERKRLTGSFSAVPGADVP